ncbi:MAG: hypothetical protein AMJ65_14975 [Phycisphaerae bacterium SG8_4]|nr:MAG: hypothetical protein AMJ65_14975 [Phycisphaerae bacterium SG8_4]
MWFFGETADNSHGQTNTLAGDNFSARGNSVYGTFFPLGRVGVGSIGVGELVGELGRTLKSDSAEKVPLYARKFLTS